MTKKTNPKILRIFNIKDWQSRGFYSKNFPKYLEEDHKIREYLKKRISRESIENIEIERGATDLKIIIKTPRAALIIGRGGKEVESIKKELDKMLADEKRNIKIEVVAIKNPWSSAQLSSKWMAGQIERRVPYRRVLKMALNKIRGNKESQGARVEVSGRLNGISMSRREWLQEGRMPKHTLKSDIDYAFNQAYTTYGVIGIKVWIYKGERKNI